jgi:hypothetical protein
VQDILKKFDGITIFFNHNLTYYHLAKKPIHITNYKRYMSADKSAYQYVRFIKRTIGIESYYTTSVLFMGKQTDQIYQFNRYD